MIDVTLLDSNILLRIPERTDPDSALVRRATRRLFEQGHNLCYVSQNIGEFWNVCTRPGGARGGLGLDIVETTRRLRLIERLFRRLPDDDQVHSIWRALIIAENVRGVQVHDARLAAMKVHGVGQILTLNPADFTRYTFVRAIHPKDV